MTWSRTKAAKLSSSESTRSYPRLADTPPPLRFFPPAVYLKFDPHGDERSPWVTTTKHRFSNGLFTFEVPRGFRCDLASVPGPLLWLFGPNGRHQRAALFHDAGYRNPPSGVERSAIDELFRSLMVADGVPYWKAWLMWAAVRCFGGNSWRARRWPRSAA